MNKLSIIIPSYNENLDLILKNLNKKGFNDSEIIIVEGGKKYNKIQTKGIKYKYLYSPNGSRASAMNLGASKSTGDLLVFLHADTILANNSYNILSKLDLNIYNYGGFYKQFDPNNFLLKTISFLNNISLALFGKLLGDNTIFVSKKLFNKIGGYKNIRLMEDIEISKKLKKYGKIKIIKDKSTTSSRKFIKNGTMKTILFMQYIRFLYFLGVKTEVLENMYK